MAEQETKQPTRRVNLDEFMAFPGEPDWFKDIDTTGGVSSGRPLAKVAFERAQRIVRDLNAAAAEVAKDKDLTDSGKAKKLARLAADARHEINKAAALGKKLDSEAASARESYRPAEAPPELVAEAWRRLPDDTLKVRQAFLDALQAGDDVTLDAITRLPTIHGGRLSADTLAELSLARRERQAPNAHAAIVQAEESADVVRSALATAADHVTEFARNLPAADPADGIGEPGENGLRSVSDAALAEMTGTGEAAIS